ncbi:MAG: hypothetical protein WD963_02185 [Candidatus Paceibacterota bacterium]
MARINFNQIFERNSTTGVIAPRTRVRVGGVTFGPGVSFGSGVSFSGIDLSRFVNNDFEVDVEGDLIIIKGIYTENSI